MHGILFDELARTSPLRNVNPKTKILLCIGSLLISLMSQTVIIPLVSALLLSALILTKGRVPVDTYLRVLLIPASFTLISTALLILLTTTGATILAVPILSSITLTITTDGLHLAATILARVAGSVTALFFLTLTTPVSDIITQLRWMKTPPEITDLMFIIYRFIFIFISQAGQIWQAQIMRLGYQRTKEAIQSFGMLCGSLFISSWTAGEGLIKAMDNRCYDGIFPSPYEPDSIRLSSLLPVLSYIVILSTFSWLLTARGF